MIITTSYILKKIIDKFFLIDTKVTSKMFFSCRSQYADPDTLLGSGSGFSLNINTQFQKATKINTIYPRSSYPFYIVIICNG